MDIDGLQNPNLQFELRILIQRRTMGSTQLLESLFLIILDCVVLNTPLVGFSIVNDAYSLHSLVRNPFCFESEVWHGARTCTLIASHRTSDVTNSPRYVVK